MIDDNQQPPVLPTEAPTAQFLGTRLTPRDKEMFRVGVEALCSIAVGIRQNVQLPGGEVLAIPVAASLLNALGCEVMDAFARTAYGRDWTPSTDQKLAEAAAALRILVVKRARAAMKAKAEAARRQAESLVQPASPDETARIIDWPKPPRMP